MRGGILALALLCGSALAAPAPPPNLVVIDARLSTAGQPSAEWLATLKEQGYEAVLYLAPATVSDAVREEPQLVAAQGLIWRHIPIPFGAPTAAHYEEFVRQLAELRERKLLVHCQVNMRASSLTFLYRVLVEGVDPHEAWEAVARVWTPQGPWRRLMLDQLRRRGIAFDPF
ncbi:protein tyrosine phosphatase family protein [Roseateles violae]|uniref:Protein tyrosine phosphatase family protein n=1 Tax=Roseateles violae TaxID=3058042 RepID=A0ABT8DWD7_9BURK|nr:protein tyrosine phosphatase family protein [Pelomonas sp. PFR6]MDN3922572.1 protein tyrosine phosphatase family protein [Pelomonas sp. PFR6]